jgi:hypothetical protein
MRDLLAVTGILIIGFASGLLILKQVSRTSHETELNWAQDALRDPAQDGCPHQYKTFANVNHIPILIGCWGNKDADLSSDLDSMRH